MGRVKDYFRPIEGATACDFLTTYYDFEWTNDPFDADSWTVPNYYSSHLGGSEAWWPRSYINGDERGHLSFWGANNGATAGGCCYDNYNGDDGVWGQPFIMTYAVVGCDGVLASGAVEDVCGVCSGDSTTCDGCDGVPNSGWEVDACGVCKGDDTSCQTWTTVFESAGTEILTSDHFATDVCEEVPDDAVVRFDKHIVINCSLLT